MKIGIYGDSWGCFNFNEVDNIESAWPELLKRQGYLVDNYCVVGETFFNVYQKFKENYLNYDVNIFLIPRLGRLYIKDIQQPYSTRIGEESSLLLNKQLLKNDLIISQVQKDTITELYSYADVYFKYKINWEQEELIRNELLEYSRLLTNSTIFIPCVDECIPWDLHTGTLMNIFAFENEILKPIIRVGEISGNTYMRDLRLCHLSEENNKMLAEKIISAIDNKNNTISIKLKDIKKPSKNIEHYMGWKEI